MARQFLGLCMFVGAALIIGAGHARAQSAAIKERQAVFDTFGDAVKEPGEMLRQEAAFDLKVVQASLKAIREGAPKLKALFPEDSKTGGNTEALAVIWTRKDQVLMLFDKLATDAAAAAAAIKDEATFKAEWGKVSSNCRGCHKVYRALPKK